MKPYIIVVLGMHRSGTSLITRSLESLGFEFGDNLIPEQIGVNDKGFWEDNDIVCFNQEILLKCNKDWWSTTPLSDQETEHLVLSGFLDRGISLLEEKTRTIDLLALKDPRIGILIKFWEKVFKKLDAEIKYILALRNPMSVASSLLIRDKFGSFHSYMIWNNYLLSILESINNLPWIKIEYEDIMREPEREINKLSKFTGLNINQDKLNDFCANFLEKKLEHTFFGLKDLEQCPDMPELSKIIYRYLSAHELNSSVLNLDTHYKLIHDSKTKLRDWLPVCRTFDQTTKEMLGLKDQAKFARIEAQHQEEKRRIEVKQAKDQEKFARIEAQHQEEKRRIEVKRLEELASELLIFNKKVKSTIPWKIYIALKFCKKTTINSVVKITGHSSAQLSRTNLGSHSNLRRKRNKVQRAVDQCKYLILLINRRGGIKRSISLSREVIERNGIASGLKIIAKSAKSRKIESNDSQNRETNDSQNRETNIADINISLIRPLYLTPDEKLLNLNLTEFSCAVHIYVESIEMLQKYLTNLSRIPVPFDLYITSSSYDLATINNRCEAEIRSCKSLSKLIFTELSHTSQHISAFLVSQQKALLSYKYLLHLQARHIEGISDSSIENDMVDILLAGENQIKEILYLLQSQANLVIAETKQTKNHSEHSSKNLQTLVERILKESQLPFDCHPDTRFDRMPKSLMFWCNDTLYRSVCGLSLSVDDLTHKDLPRNASIDKAIEVIIGLMSYGIAEQKIVSLRTKLFDYTSIFYEDHIDYSKLIQKQNQKNKINMLAYFLPQFSETFENNIWHGNGFTEWRKCQESNPLFEDHYQQRVPHKSIGYYDLKNHSELIRIRKSMQFSGIDGLIFYHYWFSGTKILNSTIESLISSKIEIPFCFCWANENWTRAWDGEDKEILMKQNYSLNDARSFINDLIPYFRDNRYINVDNRPMLFVYRPSSNPMMKDYIKIWKEECIKNRISEPYLVCCLTRETTNPFDYNFDCGVERVLHDWTDGKAQDISKQQDMFNTFTGSVLNYEDVASVYKNYVFKGKSFPLIRSIVPMWDNTARYKDRAFVVHNSSPEAFYDWLKYLYENAERLDDKSSKFVVINAWNEWAEGAYIEPDTKYGYAYMNAIGKVKANNTFRQQIVAEKIIQTGYKICINIDSIQAKLSKNKSVAEKFWFCIETAFKNNLVVVNENFQTTIPYRIKNNFSEGVPAENDSINLIFSSIELIGPNFLNDLLEHLSLTKRHTYLIQSINESLPLASGGSLFVEQECFNHHKGIIVENNILEFADKRGLKCNFTNPSLVPGVFSSHVDIDLIEQTEGRLKDYGESLNAEVIISVIIRIHATAKMELFENSIFCLYTMVGNFTVRPIICCQDLELEQYKSINKVLQKYKWHKAPVILQYTSSDHENDCRARMLTEPLLTIESDYFAYLDYDDLIYPHAYITLITNLLTRGKNITFGRVFKLEYDPNAYIFTKKSESFDSGTSYKDFLDNNRFPIHSFLISKKAIDNKELSFIPGMKYMEDYYLLLQLINPDSSDWLSATEKIYIGEYMHDLHNEHGTLSRGDVYNSKLLSNSEYLDCERLIQQARASAEKIHNKEM